MKIITNEDELLETIHNLMEDNISLRTLVRQQKIALQWLSLILDNEKDNKCDEKNIQE